MERACQSCIDTWNAAQGKYMCIIFGILIPSFVLGSSTYQPRRGIYQMESLQWVYEWLTCFAVVKF